MRIPLILILNIMLMLIIFQSCSKNSNEIPIIIEEPKETTTVEQLCEGNQKLGWNLVEKEILANKDQNVVISPLSIQIALQMALNGAKGVTQDEILNVLGCENCDPLSINEQTKVLTQILSLQSGEPTLSVSNGFFYDDKKLTLNPTSSLKDYECAFQTSDFKNENSSLDLINTWVKNKTNGKIDKIITEIKDEDIAFLINALYFKASWTAAFPDHSSSRRDFTTSKGIKSEIDFMGTDRQIPHYRENNQMVVDLPFQDSTYSFSLISLENSSKVLSLELYKSLISKLKYDRGIVNIPKLKITYENDIIKSLQSLGMITAFQENKADFTRMGSAKYPFFINQIKHKVALDLDEKGVEGAAVTSISFGVTEAPPSLTFDRPFYVVLRHIQTNAIIFVGKINDPSQ
jgi:serine protease inhibitor